MTADLRSPAMRPVPGLMRWLRSGLALVLALCLMPAAQAHLMPAQRGTLNLVGDGGFMVLSLPVSAFNGVDENGDGEWSTAELRAHEAAVQAQLRGGVQLLQGGRPLPLQGLMLQLSPAHPDGQTGDRASQIVVLGRFALDAGDADLRFRLRLFGSGADEGRQQITVSRGERAQRLLLTPGRDEGPVLPPAWTTLKQAAVEGAMHVLAGPDHLLFLLVVLASGWGLRQVVLALSCFTLGHGITLVASTVYGLAAPSAVVEPAIAATIVGMVVFDVWSKRRQTHLAAHGLAGVRLGLVFVCALVHGLGLAGALGDLGLSPDQRLWSLAGFNLGVEAAQLGVALGLAALCQAWRMAGLPMHQQGLARAASLAAMTVGMLWFVQRTAGLA